MQIPDARSCEMLDDYKIAPLRLTKFYKLSRPRTFTQILKLFSCAFE